MMAQKLSIQMSQARVQAVHGCGPTRTAWQHFSFSWLCDARMVLLVCERSCTRNAGTESGLFFETPFATHASGSFMTSDSRHHWQPPFPPPTQLGGEWLRAVSRCHAAWGSGVRKPPRGLGSFTRCHMSCIPSKLLLRR